MSFIYVIMPVLSDPNHNTKRSIIEKAAKEVGLDAHFPVDIYGKGHAFDAHKTIGLMQNAASIMADLSLERPSCYYEVGLAQALRRPTLLIAESGTNIHQVSGRDEIGYYSSLDDLRSLTKKLIRAVQ